MRSVNGPYKGPRLTGVTRTGQMPEARDASREADQATEEAGARSYGFGAGFETDLGAGQTPFTPGADDEARTIPPMRAEATQSDTTGATGTVRPSRVTRRAAYQPASVDHEAASAPVDGGRAGAAFGQSFAPAHGEGGDTTFPPGQDLTLHGSGAESGPKGQLDTGHDSGLDTGRDTGMAKLDPRVSRMKYRLERLMLTPLFRFSLRVVLPFVVVFGGVSAWFAVEENREAFHLMVADVRAAVESRPEFQVKVMAVDGASEAVSEAIRAEASVNFPVSSFDLDLVELQARISALDAVETAELRIRQGGVLQVDVTERVPQVLWRSDEGLRLLDGEGILVGRARARADHTDLPIVAGEGAEFAVDEALRLWSVSGPIRSRLRGFERMGARRWDVVLDRDQRILLPEEGAVQALERVIAMAMAPQVDLLARDLVAVDLRLPRRPVIRMSENATQEMWRIKVIEAGLQ